MSKHRSFRYGKLFFVLIESRSEMTRSGTDAKALDRRIFERTEPV